MSVRSPRRVVADVAEDVEFILTHHPYTLARDIAPRLGYAAESGLRLALTRAGRQDLLTQLARNADLTCPTHRRKRTA